MCERLAKVQLAMCERLAKVQLVHFFLLFASPVR